MLQNLEIIDKNTIQISENNEVTDTERKRFNSQFEFFASENLTSDNIKELINTTENNLEDIKVLLKNGEIQDIDMDELNSSNDSSEYKKNISELLFYIKQNSNNKEKVSNALKYIENDDNKYNVSIEYDNNGLAKIIRAKIQNENE